MTIYSNPKVIFSFIFLFKAFVIILCSPPKIPTSRPFFTHSGLYFLKHYGHHYGLFASFFENNTDNYNKSKLSFIIPKESINFDMNEEYSLSDSFNVRNYKSYSSWEFISSVDTNSYANLSTVYDISRKRDEFIPEIDRNKCVQYNNRFRFGNEEHDRFLSIGFNRDPWDDQNINIQFIPKTDSFKRKPNTNYYCSFKYPSVGMSELVSHSSLHHCKVPGAVLRPNITNHLKEIHLDFLSRPSDKSSDTDFSLLLSNIKVKRLHKLDRRHFNVTVCTMVNDLEDPLLREWLVYNLALGVQHFYLFDNRKIFPNNDGEVKAMLQGSKLRPFLDANLITLIYFPFSPAGDGSGWNQIQGTTFQVFIQQFGYYNNWVGFYDLDEFLLPSIDLQEEFLYLNNKDHHKDHSLHDHNNIILNILTKLETSKKVWNRMKSSNLSQKVDAVLFNSLEMACDDKDNYYLSPSNERKAMTTHCFVEGFYFRQQNFSNGMKHDISSSNEFGHGKIFIRPSQFTLLQSPHEAGDNPVFALPEFGGYFSHFNKLKYSSGVYQFKTKPDNHSLETFTYKLLQNAIGVKTDKNNNTHHHKININNMKSENKKNVKNSGTSKSSSAMSYYHPSGVEFIKQYGKYYHFFDLFLKEKNFAKNSLSYPIESLHTSINSSYRVRSYKDYFHFEYIAHADRSPLVNDITHYPTKEKSSSDFIAEEIRADAIHFNNRFRYGPIENDRFLAIVFSKDPWEYADATVNFIARAVMELDSNIQYFCIFTSPVEAISPLQLIDGVISSCLIPKEVRSSLTNSISEIKLNFARKLKAENEKKVILSNIKIKRLHKLDRRHFDVSVCTMVNDLEDPLVREWLVYNLALGIQHFYIFDNRKIFPNANNVMENSIYNSSLRPFLDANLITLIYHPYIPTGGCGWNCIQSNTFQVMLQQFGFYNKWVGFYDVDEFFVPSSDFQQEFLMTSLYNNNNKNSNSTIFPNFLRSLLKELEHSTKANKLEPKSAVASAWFNSLEMGCDNNDNYYMSKSTNRESMTINCHKRGFYFKQNEWENGQVKYIWDSEHGHGKIFLKPSEVQRLESPHMHGRGVLGLPEHGGYFCHYNNFRYTKGLDFKNYSNDNRLEIFTRSLFQTVFGFNIV